MTQILTEENAKDVGNMLPSDKLAFALVIGVIAAIIATNLVNHVFSPNSSDEEHGDVHKNGMSRIAYFISSGIVFAVVAFFVLGTTMMNMQRDQFSNTPISDVEAMGRMWSSLIPMGIGAMINSFLVTLRVRDFGGSAILFVLLMLVPVVNIFVWFYLVFKSGKKAIFAAAKQDKLRKQWEKEARNIE